MRARRARILVGTGLRPPQAGPPVLLFIFAISLWSFAGTPRRPVDLRQSPAYSPRATAPSCALPSGLRQLRGDRTGGPLVGPSDTQQPRQSGSTVGTLRARRDSPRAAHFRAPKREPWHPGSLSRSVGDIRDISDIVPDDGVIVLIIIEFERISLTGIPASLIVDFIA